MADVPAPVNLEQGDEHAPRPAGPPASDAHLDDALQPGEIVRDPRREERVEDADEPVQGPPGQAPGRRAPRTERSPRWRVLRGRAAPGRRGVLAPRGATHRDA